MFFKKKLSFEQKLIESLGFAVTIKDMGEVKEIIGIATKKGCLNFFIQIIADIKHPNEEQKQQYQERLKQVKKLYPIDKDFLIGHIYLSKRISDSLESALLIQALVQVTDPQNEYDYLGPIAMYLHENDLKETSGLAVNSILSVEAAVLKQSLSWTLTFLIIRIAHSSDLNHHGYSIFACRVKIATFKNLKNALLS